MADLTEGNTIFGNWEPENDKPIENMADLASVPMVSDEEMTDQELRAWMLDIKTEVTKLSEKSVEHTTAVNQFGQMLQYVVNSVSGFATEIQQHGIMGIMKNALGGKK